MRSLALLSTLFLIAPSFARAEGVARPRAGEPPSDANGDVAQLPLRHPDATWLPVDLVGLRIRTELELNGVRVPVILDTGATTTTISAETAHKIGLDGPLVTRTPVKITDANRHVVEGYVAGVDAVILGSVRVRGVRALVLPDPRRQTLIGYDVLAHVDLLFALDEGLVGVFPPGKAPVPPRARSTKISTLEHPLAYALFDDSGREIAPFIIDTGAPFTILQDTMGDAFRVPLDTAYRTSVVGVSGRARTSKGTYRVTPLRLGRERIELGPVLALRGEVSLLGNDLLLRYRTLLSSENALLSFAGMPIRPPTRSVGPDGKPCANGPCVRVRVASQGTPATRCLAIDVDAAWAGKTVEGLIDVVDANGAGAAEGQGVFFFEMKVPAEGAHVCIGVDDELRPASASVSLTPSLLRFRARQQPACAGELCAGFTGLARSSPNAAR